MKYVRIVLALVFVCCIGVTMAVASPFIICDPQTGVQYYKVTGAGWVPVTNVTAQPDGSIKMDIAAATVGTSNLNFVACMTTTEWGEVCSTATPFSFTRPTSPAVPQNLRLEK